MLTAHLTKSIITKSLFTKAITSVYSTSNQDRQQTQNTFKQKRPDRELKPYEKLFFTSPIMNINIEMVMAINELRPKATYIIANKNAHLAKQITNSTYNIIECLSYIQGYKYFFKSFPSLSQNMARVLDERIEFSATGVFKTNAIKKFVLMITNIDSLYGETFIQCISVFLIWALQNSIKTRHTLTELISPLKSRLRQVKDKRKSIAEAKRQENQQTLEALDQQIHKLQGDIKKTVLKNRFMKEEDFLSGLHYCLQRGYYSEAVVKEFVQNILEKNNYNFPDFDAFLEEEEYFFNDKPITGIFNRKAMIYSRMYSNVVHRIKILNELKKMKLHDPKFMDFIRKNKPNQQSEVSESSSEDSPFIDGKKIEESSSQSSSSEQKSQQIDVGLIQQSLIPKKAYLNLVSAYLQLFERKDILLFILSQQNSLQGIRIMQTEFFSYLNNETNRSERVLTLNEVKSKYLSVFKEIFNVEKNGYLYVESTHSESAFEIILRMYDYNDRKEVYELLRLYERYLVSKNVENMKTLAPFYVFEKYGYRSNFMASKLFEFINSKYRTRDESPIKEELIVNSLDICRFLCLYFKLLQGDLPNLFSHYDMNTGAKPKGVGWLGKGQIHFKQQMEFQQAIEIFLHNYNKLISVVYLEKQNSRFIGKGLELYYEYIRSKYLTTKQIESAMIIDGKGPEEDIRKIMYTYSSAIKSHRSYVKNIYEKQFQIDTAPLTDPNQSQDNLKTSPNKHSYTFNQYTQCMLTKRNSLLSPLDQVSTILEIVQTAAELQSLKNMEFYQDVLAVFKSIFENQKLVKLLTQQQIFPQILKRMIRITQIFKGSYKNESNKLFESLLNLTKFNLNSYLHTARINIARQVINAEKSVMIDEAYQPYMHTLEMSPRIQRNMRIWPNQTYSITKENVTRNVRSDILHAALLQNAELQKTIRDELAKIKTVKPNERVKNIKFQLNYLEYPYLANVAINKNNELIVILVRRHTTDSDKPYNAVLNRYYEESQKYFKKKGNRVVVINNEHEIRNTLKELIK